MTSKGLLIYLAGFMTIAAIAFGNIFRMNTYAVSNVSKTYYYKMANNLSQSGINMALRRLANDITWRTGYTDLSMFSGRVTVKLKDTTYKGIDVIKITSVGYTDSVKDDWGRNNKLSVIRDTATVYVKHPSFFPATVKAAITTNNPVETNGGLVVDGEDHDLSGNLIAGKGTLGIWTTQDLDQKGNSKIGGTASGTDQSPSKNPPGDIIQTNQVWPGGYPNSPDKILGGESSGYPEGKLKALAQSGVNGSQYVTNPSGLTYPLKGITYVELPNGGNWQPVNFEGSGILIVHNSNMNAKMDNINSGTFKGIVIADDIVHIHNPIIGALIGLSPSPSEGNCIGNGNGSVKFSKQAVQKATESAAIIYNSDANIVLYVE